jgi:hypothetical protein
LQRNEVSVLVLLICQLIAPLEALLPSGRCQLKVEDASVETEKLALSEDLINNSIVGNALFGLSQSAACTRDWMKGLLQQQARYPALEHLMFANIQTKLDILDGKLESITNQIDSLSSQRTRKCENIVDEYYSKKSRFMSSSSPLSDDIPSQLKPLLTCE